MFTLIADSGSTKTDWRLADPSGQLHQVQTEGYNPYYISEDDMAASLRKHLQPQLMSLGANAVQQVFFYGAGCANEEKCKTVSAAIHSVFRPGLVEVHSDMLGAARALCGRRAGIAAILGTGSNSCFYDGNQIVFARPSLGYVLGDEGSGAHLGKQLVRAFLYGDLPEPVAKRFAERFGLDKTAVLEKLYRQPLPNRFLAGFAKFIYQNQEDVFLNKLIADSFRAFFDVHICRYDRCNEYAFNCTGSIGFYFSNLLRRVAEEKGMSISTITETPIAGLALYHLGE